MPAVAILAAGEKAESVWGVIGIAITTVGLIVVAWLSWRAKRNTEPTGGSSPHDAVMTEINALTRQMQIMDERSVVEQRTAHDVHLRLLDGQDRLEQRQERLASRQDEQAAMIDRILVQLDVTGAQNNATVDLIHRITQTGG